MHNSDTSLKSIVDLSQKNESPSFISLINTKYLSIVVTDNTSKSKKTKHKKPLEDFKEISSATLPKQVKNLDFKKKTLNEVSNFEKGFFNKYIQPWRKQDHKSPKFEKSEKMQKPSVKLENYDKEKENEKVPETPIATNSLIHLMISPPSQCSIQGESQENIINESPCEFKLEDYNFLQEIIRNEKKTLEEEFKTASAKNVTKINLNINGKNNTYWDKLRNTLTAVNRMQYFSNEIKNFGTNFALSGLKVKNADFENKLRIKKKSREWVLKPGDRALIFWEILLLFALVYCVLITPIRCVFFDDEMELYPNWKNFETFLTVFFALDMVITINTAYLMDNKWILSRGKILWKYAKFWFWIDFFSVYWIENVHEYYPNNGDEDLAYLSFFFFGSHLYELLRIFRVRKITIFWKILVKLQDCLKIKYAYVKLLTFFLSTLLCLHLVSCIWFFLAKIKNFAPDTWVFNNGLANDVYFDLYIAAFYWATATLSTVGYGDIHATNELEHFFSIIWLIFGAGFYSFTIGSISTVITTSETKRSLLFHKKIIMESFMKENKLSKALQHKIKKALEYHSAKSVFSHHDKQEILNEIPVDLKFEIATSLIQNMKTHIPFFSKKDKVFMAHFIPLLTPLNVTTGELLYKKSEYPSLFYILLKGRVNFIIGSSKIVYKTMIEGSYFGEIEIFYNCVRICTLQAVTNLDLLILTRKEFEQVMKTFPEIEAEMKENANEKLRRIKESEQKIKPFLTIPKNSTFWNHTGKTKYQQYKEKKKMEYRKSCSPILQRKSSISRYFSRKKSLGSPNGKFSSALKKLSVFSGNKESSGVNFNIESISNYDNDNKSEKEKKFSPFSNFSELNKKKIEQESWKKENEDVLFRSEQKIKSSPLSRFREFNKTIEPMKKLNPLIKLSKTNNNENEKKLSPFEKIQEPVQIIGSKLREFDKIIENHKKLAPLGKLTLKNEPFVCNFKNIEVFERGRTSGLGEMRRNLLDLEKKETQNLEKPDLNIVKIQNNRKLMKIEKCDKITKHETLTKINKKSQKIENLGDLVQKNKKMLIGFEEKIQNIQQMALDLANMVFSLKIKQKNT